MNENKHKLNIVIVGGGASGVATAIFAKRKNPNNEVIILEKNDKICKKVLISGNGRCNLLNKNLDINKYHTEYFNNTKEIIENVFKKFDNKKILNFFENLGILFKEEKDGKFYPITDSANSIVNVLLYELEKLNIKVFLNTAVKDIKKDNNIFIIKTNNDIFSTDKVVISTGGCAYPQIGTTGDGYIFAERFNHKIIKPFPSVVPLIIDCKYLKKISGIKFSGNAKIIFNNQIIKENGGDILFTDYGISGSAIISISRYATELLNKNIKNKLFLSIDFLPNLDEEKLQKHIINIKNINKEKDIKFLLLGLINPKLIDYIFLDRIDLNKKLIDLNIGDIKLIVDVLKNTKYKITGSKDFRFAQVTAGGVNLKEINNNLESKKVKGLFFTGEVLDVDGDCGGFNLMWAFASGAVVGDSL
ncbi:MAG TPA: NAD(P)/FAD-dependent oxidoreductase [bacterium]|nr:NAD(P)/FAD-dependent oxidoreductase [bacterium]HQL11497.1 NAD(P)/FAD-dependent oxidoreductase [bacterium]